MQLVDHGIPLSDCCSHTGSATNPKLMLPNWGYIGFQVSIVAHEVWPLLSDELLYSPYMAVDWTVDDVAFTYQLVVSALRLSPSLNSFSVMRQWL